MRIRPLNGLIVVLFMYINDTLKLVFYGHSGSGKSTSAQIARNFFEDRAKRVVVLKLAQPLYELQQQFYQVAGQDIDFYAQDQILLETIATQLRRISPTSIINHFIQRLQVTEADVVINDDLRDVQVDYPTLKQQGFQFIRIFCREDIRLERLRQRRDYSVVVRSTTTTSLDAITHDILIDNSDGNIDILRAKIHHEFEAIL